MLFAALALIGSQTSYAEIQTYDLDLAGWQSDEGYSGPGSGTVNSFTTINIGAFSTITAVEYIDLNFESIDPSWQSEFVLSLNSFEDSGLYWDFNPAVGTDAPGSFSGSGSFPDPGLYGGSFSVGSDGILYIETYEDFNDASVSPDAVVSSGILRITFDTTAVPEPSCAAVLGLAFVGLVGFRRRRV